MLLLLSFCHNNTLSAETGTLFIFNATAFEPEPTVCTPSPCQRALSVTMSTLIVILVPTASITEAEALFCMLKSNSLFASSKIRMCVKTPSVPKMGSPVAGSALRALPLRSTTTVPISLSVSKRLHDTSAAAKTTAVSTASVFFIISPINEFTTQPLI